MVNTTIETEQLRERTQKILANVINLPVISKVMFEAVKLLDNQFTTAAELTKIISKDQSLVTKIITIANSPLYGLQRKVTTIEFAILILGYRELRNIISALSVAEAFRNKSDKFLNQKEFMLHSYLTGTACKKIATDMGFQNGGEAFIAGFLHDVGISVIHRYLHSNYVSIVELVENHGMSYHDAELQVMGLTHEQVGHFLLEKWNFPVEICDTVFNHHNCEETGPASNLSAIVNLADYMTNKLKVGEFIWDNKIELHPFTMKKFNFENDIDVDKYLNNHKDLFYSQLEFVRFLN